MDVLIITGHEATLMHYESEKLTKTYYNGTEEVKRALDTLRAGLDAEKATEHR